MVPPKSVSVLVTLDDKKYERPYLSIGPSAHFSSWANFLPVPMMKRFVEPPRPSHFSNQVRRLAISCRACLSAAKAASSGDIFTSENAGTAAETGAARAKFNGTR